MFLGSFI